MNFLVNTSLSPSHECYKSRTIHIYFLFIFFQYKFISVKKILKTNFLKKIYFKKLRYFVTSYFQYYDFCVKSVLSEFFSIVYLMFIEIENKRNCSSLLYAQKRLADQSNPRKHAMPNDKSYLHHKLHISFLYFSSMKVSFFFFVCTFRLFRQQY